MVLRFLKASIIFILVALASSCSPSADGLFARPKAHDVRDVAVLADGRVPPRIIAGIDGRLSAAIASTSASAGAPRVILTVRIDRFEADIAATNRLSRAVVTVTAVSVENGAPIATGTFKAVSRTDDPQFEEESLAEEISGRVRSLFSLSAPRLRR